MAAKVEQYIAETCKIQHSYAWAFRSFANRIFHSVSTIYCSFHSASHSCGSNEGSTHEWLAESKVQYIIETKQKNILAQFLHTLLLKVCVKLCCILQASTIYSSTLAAIIMAVSFPHHCHMSGWLSGKNSIL